MGEKYNIYLITMSMNGISKLAKKYKLL